MFPDDEGNGPVATVGRLSGPPLSRRQFMQIAGVAGFAAAALDLGLRDGYAFAAGSGGTSSLGSGTVPEQIHLTWGANPAAEVTVSWASPQPEVTPQVTLSPAVGGQTVVVDVTPAVARRARLQLAPCRLTQPPIASSGRASNRDGLYGRGAPDRPDRKGSPR